MYYYTATAHKAGSVSCALTLHSSVDARKTFLLMSQQDCLKLFTIDEKGPGDGKLYEAISQFTLLVKVPSLFGDYVFGVNDAYYGLFMGISEQAGIETSYRISLKESPWEPFGPRPLGFYSAALKALVFILYKGLLNVFPVDQSAIRPSFGDHFTVRIRHANVLDLCDFTKGDVASQGVGFLVQATKRDSSTAVQFVVYDLSVKERELGERELWRVTLPDETYHKVVGLEGKVVIMGIEKILLYKYAEDEPHVALQLSVPAVTLAFGLIDEHRILLGNSLNQLCLLVIQDKQIAYEYLGMISRPSDITYIDNGVVYISSVADNPLFLRLKSAKTADPGNPFIEVISRQEHLGSVVDFVPVESRATGVSQLVACANHMCSSSVYVLGKGISVHKLAAAPLTQVADVWTLNCEVGHFLIAAFISETRVFYWNKASNEISEVELGGIIKKQRTILCGTVDQCFVQITKEGINVSTQGERFSRAISQYTAPKTILHAAINSKLIAISEHNDTVKILELPMKELNVLLTIAVQSEISALSLSDSFLAFSSWDNMLQVFSIDDKFKELVKMKVEAEAAVRAIEFCSFETDKGLLFCGTADGFLISFELKAEDLFSTCKYVSLGTQHVKLKKLLLGDSQVIVGCSETATLIHYFNGTVQYSPINLEGVVDVAAFNVPQAVPATGTPSKAGNSLMNDVLLIATREKLIVGIVDEIQHISSARINLAELQVRRVAYDDRLGTIVVVADSESPAHVRGQVLTFSVTTYSQEAVYQLESQESGCSLALVRRSAPEEHVGFALTARAWRSLAPPWTAIPRPLKDASSSSPSQKAESTCFLRIR